MWSTFCFFTFFLSFFCWVWFGLEGVAWPPQDMLLTEPAIRVSNHGIYNLLFLFFPANILAVKGLRIEDQLVPGLQHLPPWYTRRCRCDQPWNMVNTISPWETYDLLHFELRKLICLLHGFKKYKFHVICKQRLNTNMQRSWNATNWEPWKLPWHSTYPWKDKQATHIGATWQAQ